MVRLQVAKLVLIEAVFIGLIGLCVGVPLGLALEAIVAHQLKPLMTLAPALDWPGVAMAACTAMGASVLASLLPAWQATRVDPIEAMTPLAAPSSDRFPSIAMLFGLVLISVDPIILFIRLESEFAQAVRFFLHFVIGLPCMMLGFFLLAPAFVWTLNRIGIPILSLILRLPSGVMRQQLDGGLWRSAGTCTSLMVGLAVLVVMQTQGNSSLNSWTLPTRFPDVFIFTRSLTGLTPAAQETIRNSPILRADDVMPIGTIAPEVLGAGRLGPLGTRFPGATMFIAIEPERGFRLMELDFRQGNAEEAKILLQRGRHVVVTEDFHRMRKLDLGDKVSFKRFGKEPVEYTIAGVVWSPGIDVMINAFDLSQQVEQQSAACVFGSIADAQRDFDLRSVWLMCGNFRELGVEKETLASELQKSLGDTGVNVADVRKLKHLIETGLGQLLFVASSIAWGALLIASLGVTNTIIASIRSRMYQFGVLRSIGLTRWALVRLVLSEALLLGIIGAVMGLTCGALMTVDARQLIALSIGHYAPINVPWPIIWLGVGVVVGVSLLASVVPAIRLARTSPLSLLQAGRAAA
jgi:putative ABC transport system permease protein